MNSSSSRRGARRPLAVLALAAALGCTLVPAAAQEALRPEVGKPLKAAEDLIKAQKYKEALAKVREADAVGGKNANESFMIERMRIAAASGAGDVDTAARSYEALQGSNRVSGVEKVRMIESIAGSYYRNRDYAKATQWAQRYFKEGGTSPAIRTLLIQSQYLSGDYAGAAKELMAETQAAEKAGTPPAEDRLKLLLNAAVKLNDNNAYVYAMEKLVTYYPKKEYWLSLASGSMSAANDYMEMAQLALQADFAAESKQVLDKGFAAGVLGTGPQAERQKRLRDLVAKRLEEDKKTRDEDERQAQAAKDGNALVNVGMNLVFNGQAAKGVLLMQQGIAKGGLKRPEDAKLHLGIAQLVAGDNAKAQQTLKTVTGADGTADLARLWALYARRRA